MQDGDNPWNLTERYLAGIKYWPRIQTLNRINDPQHIPPGTRLRIPVEWLRRVDAIAKVAAVHGQAEVRGKRATRALTAGMQLRSGDVVQTGREANVTLEFADGSRVLVHAEAELHLDALGSFENTDYYDTQVRLTQGRMENLVAPLGKGPGRFEISTPAAVTAVRGTRYRVNAGADATRSEVLEGRGRGQHRAPVASMSPPATARSPRRRSRAQRAGRAAAATRRSRNWRRASNGCRWLSPCRPWPAPAPIAFNSPPTRVSTACCSMVAPTARACAPATCPMAITSCACAASMPRAWKA